VRLVIGLGGNALLRRGEPMEAEVQRGHAREAAEVIARIAREHDIVLTHGNGPQVGLLALQAASYPAVAPYPLDLLNAETEGMLGYLLEQELGNRLRDRSIASLLTQVEVDPADPAFLQPDKPIGPLYPSAEIEQLSRRYGWRMAAEEGGCRRVVPSPRPVRIVELSTIRLLLDAGALVICAGGGGIPVVSRADGSLVGVEAVIDKDRSTSLLAEQIGAERLLLLTDVDAVYAGWGSPQAIPLRETTPPQLAAYVFARGSMGPKVEAACRFVSSTGRVAVIGRLRDAEAMLRGERGTLIAPPAEAPA
jgi:carbamate kinase